ncbi:putative monooxygenase [Nocardia nova SH22a]|uniref:Putative monooxygenase n=1 Tax=Nocardia nova SH22a TaxID=1415166 RepID=W5TLH6_9NOCA|nr:NAD(P)/FAD-dependent oxidoreductase [Nocardia nova]AHH19813.1 putative monooxygenase [Nocardia nova SH22a]
MLTSTTTPHHHIAIVGSGFGGIATAVRLRRAGFSDFVMLERADEVGGVWRDNDYPGAAVDVQSNLYSYSFAPNPDWRNTFAEQPELFAYLRGVADSQGLREHLVLECTVERLAWDPAAQVWRIETTLGARTATHVVLATGALADPVIPAIPGLDRFGGMTFHSARWNHDYDLTGKRVAVVGTGPSAVQFVPAIAPEVTRLTVFQRTPAWVVPRHDSATTALTRAGYRRFPALQRLERLRVYLRREWQVVAFRHPALMALPERTARRHLEAQVADERLREKLLPDFRLGCKRVLISDDYLRALDRPNVGLHTDGIASVTETGLVDNNGTAHDVDAIIFGTGFRTAHLPLTDRTFGPDGRAMTDVWDGNPTAYLGTSVSGFPNMYLIHGPNIGLGHTSVIHMFESQANYIAGAIGYARDHDLAAVEPTAAAQRAFARDVERLGEGTVWTAGGCTSWYLDENGRNTNIWPGSTYDFRRRTLRFDPTRHLFHRRTPSAVTA